MSNTAAASNQRMRRLTGIAVLSAAAFILSFIEFPLPISPSFYKMDVSDLPALIGSFAYGPLAGAAIELLKNLLGAFSSTTGGVGEFANFIMGASFVVPAGMVYKRKKTKKGAIIACVVGSVCRGIGAAFANYFIMLPLYSAFMPMDAIIAAFTKIMPFIHTKLEVVLFNVLPFNILKGALNSLAAMLIYKRLSPVLHGR